MILAAITGNVLWPFAVLGCCVVLIVVLITILRVHAFLALILAALTAGLLSPVGSLPGEPGASHWVQAIELTTRELGITAGKVALVIALASVIGMCLMESGAADKIVRRFLALFGEKRAGGAMVVSTYLISIPIFFDTIFMLLLPLARALQVRLGKNYLLYVLAICCAGSVTHSMVAPHPGPLAMAETLNLDLGLTIMAGLLVGVFPVACSWMVAKWINSRLSVPMREVPGISQEDLEAYVAKPEDELPSFGWSIMPVILPIILISAASTLVAIQSKGFSSADIADWPGLAQRLQTAADPLSQHIIAQMAPADREILARYHASAKVPERSILAALNRYLHSGELYRTNWFQGVSLRDRTQQFQQANPQGGNLVRLNRLLLEDAFGSVFVPTVGVGPDLFLWIDFVGNRNIALLFGAVIAMWILARQKHYSVAKICTLIGPSLETAGVIILITSAGGAFGLMLRNAGVGDAIKAMAVNYHIDYLLLAYLVACVIRIAQGSATVAMLTTAAMMLPLIGDGSGLAYHPVYIFLAIGFGAMVLSWMNDSGFWVISRLSGFTERETLKSWTVIATVNSVVGFITTWIFASLLPLKGL